MGKTSSQGKKTHLGNANVYNEWSTQRRQNYKYHIRLLKLIVSAFILPEIKRKCNINKLKTKNKKLPLKKMSMTA